MATISELNVRLGLLYKDFDSALKKVERDLERSGRKFSQLGNDLTLAISAPLAALGAAAIQQAGEIESLKLAMQSAFQGAGRSAAEAATEVELLRKAAKAPGLDFEQAIKGSIRLQGVGLAAEEARTILERMANAISLTGGTAQELDSVTRQFAQIISKGRVLQEDITILSENMPIIAELMQKAFGTASVEAIRKAGVTGKEFVTRITEAAAALPKVEGGIKNALVNASAEARNALAKLGETLVKAFDLPKTLGGLTDALSGAVDWFDRLSDSAKAAVAQTGLFLVVLGPLVKVIGTMLATGSAVVTVLRGIGTAIAGLAGGTLTATAAWQGLNTAMRATVIGAVLTAVTALYIGFNYLTDSMDTAAVAGKSVAEAQKFIAQSAATEIVELQKSISVLSSATTSQLERGKAIADLTSKYPEYLKGINLEVQSSAQLAIIQRELTNEIIKQSAARAKANAEAELTAKIVEKELKLFQLRQDEREGKFTLQDRSFIIQNEQNKLEQLKKQLDTVRETYDKVFQLNKGADSSSVITIVDPKSVKNAGDAAKAVGEVVAKTQEQIEAEKLAAEEAAKAAKKRKDLYADVLKSIDAVNKKQAELGADFVGEKTKEIESGVEKLIEAGFAPNSAPVQKLKGYLQQIRAEISKGFGVANNTQIGQGVTGAPAAPQQIATLPTPQSVTSTQDPAQTKAIATALELATQQAVIFDSALIGAQERWATWVTQVQEGQEYLKTFWDATGAAMQAVGESMTQLGNSIEQSLASSSKSFKEFARDAINAVADVIAALIKQAVAAAIAGAFKSSGNPILGAALAAIGGALAAGLFKKLVGAATYKAFAKGGVVTQPTLGLVGEYPGASRNPEIITPERLMRSVFREEAGMMGGQVEVVGVIRGSDILLSNLKADRERGRIR